MLVGISGLFAATTRKAAKEVPESAHHRDPG